MSVRVSSFKGLSWMPILLVVMQVAVAAPIIPDREVSVLPERPAGAEAIMRAVDGVSLRARPENSAPRYGIVAIGQPVIELARESGWAQVRANGRTGWVRADFLEPMRLDEDSAATTDWMQARETAILRSSPNITSRRIGRVAATRRLRVIATKGDWTRVRFADTGWLYRDFLIDASDAGLAGRFLRTAEGVNLRAGPGVTTERVDALGPDEWVEQQSTEGNWVKVQVERRGWVYSSLLEPAPMSVGSSLSAPATTPFPEVSKTPGAAAPIVMAMVADAPERLVAKQDIEYARAEQTRSNSRVVTLALTNAPIEGESLRESGEHLASGKSVMLRAVDGVSLRARPDSSAPRYGIVGIGQPVEKIRQEENWTEVRVDGRTGWIRTDFLEPLHLVADTGSGSRWLQASQAASLRSAPGLDSRKLGSVPSTIKLQQISRREDWTRVRFEELGWLHRDYLEGPQGADRAGRYLRTSEGVNLRAKPAASSARVNALGPEQWVEEIARQGDWVKVRVERRGWVYSRLLIPATGTSEVLAKKMKSPESSMRTPADMAPTRIREETPSESEASMVTEIPALGNRRAGQAAPAPAAIIGAEAGTTVTPCVTPPGSAARRPGTPVLTYEPRCDATAIAPPRPDALNEFPPVPDRWRIMSMFYPRNLFDPYNNNNPLKGDLPLFGEKNDWFFNLLFISDTVYEPRRFPVPVGGPSTLRPGGIDLFGSGRQTLLNQNFIVELVLYQGDTVFRPPDWEFRFIPVFNYSDTRVDEVSLLKPNPGFGLSRKEGFVGIQGLFIDKHLRNVSTRYDFDSLRVGIQPFSSDFRGFLFQDNQFGVRLFGTRDNNIYQYNLAWFRRLEKDANSGLNDITERSFGDSLRDDDVFVANVYKQDFPRLGFFSQLTLLYNRNRESGDVFYEDNGFIQRPASIGTERTRDYDVVYLGYNGDGHFGRNNLTTSFYLALGDETNTTFTNTPSDIRAWFFAAEFSRDYDWFRPKLSILHGSGDDDPFDDKSEGFDAVFENPQFAGADTSFWIRQGVPLVGGGRVGLSGRNGILNSLRPSKEFGQSNFINPGIWLLGLGADLDLTPELRLSLNANQLWFDDSISVAVARNQGNVAKNIGLDVSAAFIYRPFATQNIVLRASGAALIPGQGYKDLFGDEVPFSILANLVLQY